MSSEHKQDRNTSHKSTSDPVAGQWSATSSTQTSEILAAKPGSWQQNLDPSNKNLGWTTQWKPSFKKLGKRLFLGPTSLPDHFHSPGRKETIHHGGARLPLATPTLHFWPITQQSLNSRQEHVCCVLRGLEQPQVWGWWTCQLMLVDRRKVHFTVRWRPSCCNLHTGRFSAECSCQALDFHTPTSPPLLAAATARKQFRSNGEQRQLGNS